MSLVVSPQNPKKWYRLSHPSIYPCISQLDNLVYVRLVMSVATFSATFAICKCCKCEKFIAGNQYLKRIVANYKQSR